MIIPREKKQVQPGFVPSQPIVWPARQNTDNRVQQTKGSATPQTASVRPSTQPSKSTVAPRTTPPAVTHIRVVTKPAKDGQKQVTVQFNHPAGNPYYAGANVYLRRAGNMQPVKVAGGAQSPLVFTVPVNQAPHVVHVASFGNWGETDVLTSPSRHVRLV